MHVIFFSSGNLEPRATWCLCANDFRAKDFLSMLYILQSLVQGVIKREQKSQRNSGNVTVLKITWLCCAFFHFVFCGGVGGVRVCLHCPASYPWENRAALFSWHLMAWSDECVYSGLWRTASTMMYMGLLSLFLIVWPSLCSFFLSKIQILVKFGGFPLNGHRAGKMQLCFMPPHLAPRSRPCVQLLPGPLLAALDKSAGRGGARSPGLQAFALACLFPQDILEMFFLSVYSSPAKKTCLSKMWLLWGGGVCVCVCNGDGQKYSCSLLLSRRRNQV